MAPIRPEDHAFVFQAAVLSELRRELGLNQAQLAEFLDVPVNTLSRWERGSNVPDANALAALFSIANDRGVTPEFFKERRSAIVNRHSRETLVIQWDYQNIPFDADDVNEFIPELQEYIQLIFPKIEKLKAIAYVSVIRSDIGTALREAGFEMKTSYFNVDRQLIQEGEQIFELPQNTNTNTIFITHTPWWADSRQKIDPGQAVYVLISNDGGYADFLERLKKSGVQVFVYGDNNCSERLIKAVGLDHFIPLQRPYMVTKCYGVASKLTGKPITKGSFGNQCKVSLEEDGFEEDDYEELLEDTGFSLNRPFASALQHMNTMGIIRMKSFKDDPNRVTLAIPGR